MTYKIDSFFGRPDLRSGWFLRSAHSFLSRAPQLALSEPTFALRTSQATQFKAPVSDQILSCDPSEATAAHPNDSRVTPKLPQGVPREALGRPLGIPGRLWCSLGSFLDPFGPHFEVILTHFGSPWTHLGSTRA